MELSTFQMNAAMTAKIAPSESGILTDYRIGADANSVLLPADTNMFGSRDLVLAASGSTTLHLDDFHVDAEGNPWPNIEGGDVNIVTLYAMFFIVMANTAPGFVLTVGSTINTLNFLNDHVQISSMAGRAAGAITVVLTETGTIEGCTVRCLAFGKDS